MGAKIHNYLRLANEEGEFSFLVGSSTRCRAHKNLQPHHREASALQKTRLKIAGLR